MCNTAMKGSVPASFAFRSIRFAVLTADSALPLLRHYPGLDDWCSKSQSLANLAMAVHLASEQLPILIGWRHIEL
jgi:hypothetical protein